MRVGTGMVEAFLHPTRHPIMQSFEPSEDPPMLSGPHGGLADRLTASQCIHTIQGASGCCPVVTHVFKMCGRRD